MKYFVCENCGNIVEYVKESGVPVVCCGQRMTELVPGSGDGAHEKHVPVVTVSGDKVLVEIGEVEHPMVEEHYIQWIAIETTRGYQRVKLSPADKPRAEFCLAGGEEFVAAYEYCNIHGLWKKNNK
ncbi:MAG: desulfoferrodoxin [Lachnospiraceae bacterium]|nr:desulfoferrodoxin [Lachnospiraceae bacterium]